MSREEHFARQAQLAVARQVIKDVEDYERRKMFFECRMPVDLNKHCGIVGTLSELIHHMNEHWSLPVLTCSKCARPVYDLYEMGAIHKTPGGKSCNGDSACPSSMDRNLAVDVWKARNVFIKPITSDEYLMKRPDNHKTKKANSHVTPDYQENNQYFYDASRDGGYREATDFDTICPSRRVEDLMQERASKSGPSTSGTSNVPPKETVIDSSSSRALPDGLQFFNTPGTSGTSDPRGARSSQGPSSLNAPTRSKESQESRLPSDPRIPSTLSSGVSRQPNSNSNRNTPAQVSQNLADRRSGEYQLSSRTGFIPNVNSTSTTRPPSSQSAQEIHQKRGSKDSQDSKIPAYVSRQSMERTSRESQDRAPINQSRSSTSSSAAHHSNEIADANRNTSARNTSRLEEKNARENGSRSSLNPPVNANSPAQVSGYRKSIENPTPNVFSSSSSRVSPPLQLPQAAPQSAEKNIPPNPNRAIRSRPVPSVLPASRRSTESPPRDAPLSQPLAMRTRARTPSGINPGRVRYSPSPPPEPPTKRRNRGQSTAGRDEVPSVPAAPTPQPASEEPPQTIRTRRVSVGAERLSVDEIAASTGLKRTAGRAPRAKTPEAAPPAPENPRDKGIVSIGIRKPQDMVRQRRSSVDYSSRNRSQSRGRSQSRDRSTERGNAEYNAYLDEPIVPPTRSQPTGTVKVPPSQSRTGGWSLSSNPLPRATQPESLPPSEQRAPKPTRLEKKMMREASLRAKLNR